MSEQKEPEKQTEPKFLWTRIAAFLSLANMMVLSHLKPDAPSYVYWAHIIVIGYWALGSNGRMAVLEFVKGKFGNVLKN